MIPTYKSDSYMFRTLTEAEEAEFAEYARTNQPKSGNWALYHPACRAIWYARGLRPDDDAGLTSSKRGEEVG